MPKTAREAALTVLSRCRLNQAFSDTLLDSVIRAAGLDSRDAALCTRLCYGVLQNQLLCDFYINHYAGKSKKLEPKLRDILRLGAYQILFLDKIPSHASVNEAVELSKKSGLSRASGLVNAILRRISENKENLPEIPTGDKIEYLSIKYSTPRPLVALFLGEFDPDFTEGLLAANNAPVPVTIQTNTLKTTVSALTDALSGQGLSPMPNPLLSNALDLSGGGDLSRLEAHQNGLFYVQDAAAMLAVLAAAPIPGSRVLDACSAPGGKSFAAGILMENRGSILSCDIHENKLRHIEAGAKRLGIGLISTAAMDATKPAPDLLGAFDLVIADVPCSGLGVIRKKPDIRDKDISALAGLPAIQEDILEALAALVAPGGCLLYSTCTILARENSGPVERFLSRHPEFTKEAFCLPEPIGAVSEGTITLYPHIHGTDGFFICKLRKNP